MFPVLVFGVLNTANWLNGLRNHGCTGHELTWLLFAVIAVGCGAATAEAGWASALVLSLPIWITCCGFLRSWIDRLVEYGSVYVTYLISVYLGCALRCAVLVPISTRLRRKREVPDAAYSQ
jgi:hypothetical protein